MNADGSNQTQITFDSSNHFFADWQPIITVTPDLNSQRAATVTAKSVLANADTLPAAGPDLMSYAVALLAFGAWKLGRRKKPARTV